MPKPLSEEPYLVELESWIELRKTGALDSLFKIFKQHQNYCRERMRVSVKNRHGEDAICWQAKEEDCDKYVNLICERIKELTELSKKGGEKS